MQHKPQTLSAARSSKLNLNESAIGSNTPEVEHERKVAIYDLLEENAFELVGGFPGPYKLGIAIVEDRLAFAVTAGNAEEPDATFLRWISTPEGREGLLHDLRELLRGHQVRAPGQDRGDRHGSAPVMTKAANS